MRWYETSGNAWHSIIGADTSDTLTNKNLTSPSLTTPTIGGGTALNKVVGGTATLTYTAISAQTAQEQNFALTGAVAGMGVICSPQGTLGNVNLTWSAWVNGANQIGVRVSNPTVGSITPNAVVWGCTSFQ